MLKELIVKNIVLIESIKIEFKKGLSVLTGETGTGKSILLDSLGLILGNRVELFEIDNQIRKVPLVKNCYVFLKEINDYEKYIFAVVEGTGVKEQNILNKLRKYLPNYMIPRQVKILKKFPVNKNNKIDRPKLKKFFDN